MAQIDCRLCFKSGRNHINLFDGTSHSSFVVSVINEHIGEVKHDDLLPNYVCHRCWKEIDTFHTFHRTVQSAQSNYLLQFVKNEFNDTEMYTDENEPELPSFVEVTYEPKNENSESESIDEDDYEDGSKEDSVSVHSEGDGVEHDNDDVKHDNSNENVESIEVNFDYTCDICGIDQGTFNQTISHYKKQHNADGYIKCCKHKYFNEASVNEHIEWHKNPEIYKCKLCPYRGTTKASFSTHNSRHKGPQRFFCDICNGTFRQKYGLTKHMKDYHINKTVRRKIFTCKSCFVRFRSSEELKAHKEICLEEEVTNKAKEQLTTVKDLISSLDPAHVDQIICQHFDMSCDQCSMKFTSLIQIQYHYLNEHQINDGRIKCCSGMTFQTQDQILEHVPYHIDKEIFKCKICGNQMTSVSSIRNHLARHTKNLYQCNQCDSKFSKECWLLRHIHETHEKRLERVVMPTITDENRANLTKYFDMKCSHSECESIIFTSLQHAKVHYLNEHNNPDGFIKCCGIICKTMYQVDEHLLYHTEPQQFMCKYCDKICLTKRQFYSHIYKHERRESGFFKCEICHKVFASKYDVRCHRKTHETKTKTKRKLPESKFQCSFCCRKFHTEDRKKLHEQRIHNDKSTTNDVHFVCEFCAKTYDKKIELKAHIKRNHSTDHQKFQCEICNAVLSNKGSFQTHVNKHSSELQKCPHCEKISPNPNALNQHIKLLHLIQPTHKCNLCDKSFKVITSLKSHMATHTGEKLFKCSFCEESFIWRPNMYAHRKKMHPKEYAEYRKQKLP